MKTLNFKKGNRSDRMRKVLLRSGAVIISVILLSFTVSAQGLWKQLLAYNSFGKMAILMVNASEAGVQAEKIEPITEAPVPSESVFFRIEPALEKTLKVEAWMTDDLYFGVYNRFFEVEQDKPLDIEAWMTDDHYFTSRFEADQDKALQIGAWMIDDHYWRY